MDKSDIKVHESQSDTSSVITMKEYASSEYPSSEPPPAYMKPHSNSLRIAKLAAFTIIVSSIILGGFILAASWIQANTARNLDLTLNQELLDDLNPSYDHLVANEVLPDQQNNAVDQEQMKNENKDETLNLPKNKDDDGLIPPPLQPSSAAKSEEKKVLDLDEIANILMQKNIKGNVNCIVEKRRNEELVDHAPMSLNLPSRNSPFGLNITTPPRLQHLTGEQMIVICKGDEDEEKDSSEEEREEDNKVDQLQSIVFPLPSHIANQIHQFPKIIPLNNLLPQLPLQQVQVQQLPMQQIQVQQLPMQQVQVQPHPMHQIQEFPNQQIPIQQHQQIYPPLQPQQQIVYHQPLPEAQQFQPTIQQQIALPQKLLFPLQQIINTPQKVQFIPEMTPVREMRMNQERIPVNHVYNHQVPLNSMAINDIPISKMPITHMPMRNEPQIKEEPVPVHHLMPPQPQPQSFQAENFKQEEATFNGPFIQEPVNRFPFFSPQLNQQRPFPVEVRDPGAIRIPGPIVQEPQEPLSMPPPTNRLFHNNVPENRERDFIDESSNRGFRPIAVDVRPRGQRKEPMSDTMLPKIPQFNSLIPLNFERAPQGNSRNIRFPDMTNAEEVRENRMPIITEITKIIPIKLERENYENNETPFPQQKNKEIPDIKLDKLPSRPFPIPINAILDMIFRGIRPLINNRGHSLPIPVDIKIERIENKEMGLIPPFAKKFDDLKKEPEVFENSNIQSTLRETNENDSIPDKNIETKIETIEVLKGENGNSFPIQADTQNSQVFKVEDAVKPNKVNEASLTDQAFLPNGQGRGARVFPIPQAIKEAEIFSVFDVKSDKSEEMEAPMESSITVVGSEIQRNSEGAENKQGKLMTFASPILNFFPLPEDKVMKPQIQISKVRPQTFILPESRSVKLYPVPRTEFEAEVGKPVANLNVEENRPHFVQPRSV